MANVIIGTTGVRNGSLEIEYSTSQKGGIRKTGSLSYTVAADAINTNEDSVATTAGIPQPYQSLNGMWCQKVQLKDAGTGKHPVGNYDTRIWIITCSFDSELDTSKGEINPLLRPVVITRDADIEMDRLIFDAVTGAPIATANNEPIWVQGPIILPVYTFTRYEVYPYSNAAIMGYTNAVNLAAFYGAPSGTALMLKVSTTEVTIQNVRYEHVTYRVKFKINPYNPSATDTWQGTVPHQGTIYKDSTGAYLNVDRDGVSRGTIYNLGPTGLKLNWNVPTQHLAFNRFRKVAFPSF